MYKTTIQAGLKINGTDILELDPFEVKDAINSLPADQQDLIKEIIKSKMPMPPGRKEIPDDYAKEYGRPSITELPYMHSENDGMPYLPGHSPSCSGEKNYVEFGIPCFDENGKRMSRQDIVDAGWGMCWCEWAKNKY